MTGTNSNDRHPSLFLVEREGMSVIPHTSLSPTMMLRLSTYCRWVLQHSRACSRLSSSSGRHSPLFRTVISQRIPRTVETKSSNCAALAAISIEFVRCARLSVKLFEAWLCFSRRPRPFRAPAASDVFALVASATGSTDGASTSTRFCAGPSTGGPLLAMVRIRLRDPLGLFSRGCAKNEPELTPCRTSMRLCRSSRRRPTHAGSPLSALRSHGIT